MGNQDDIKNHVFVVGANHRSSSMALRDRLYVEDDAVPAVLQDLKHAGIEQAIVMSTPDRVEVYSVSQNPKAGADKVIKTLGVHAHMAPGDLDGQMYTHFGSTAVRHIFSIAAALDSLVVGEPQVLGQVKASHAMAAQCSMVGPTLEAIMQAAYSVAVRVRNETGVGEGPVSIAAAAVQLAADLHGDLARCSGLLIGGGDMGDLVGGYLKAAGVRNLRVTHPLPTRAKSAARELDCHIAPYDQLPQLLAETDVVLTALNRRDHAVTKDMVKAAIKARRRKPVFIIDAGIPGDVDPAVNDVEEAFLYDLNDLERVAMEGRVSREGQTQEAWDILGEELSKFMEGADIPAPVSTLSALHAHFEARRTAVLAQNGDDAGIATQMLIEELLRAPSDALRDLESQAGAENEAASAHALLNRLFALSDPQKKPNGD